MDVLRLINAAALVAIAVVLVWALASDTVGIG